MIFKGHHDSRATDNETSFSLSLVSYRRMPLYPMKFDSFIRTSFAFDVFFFFFLFFLHRAVNVKDENSKKCV